MNHQPTYHILLCDSEQSHLTYRTQQLTSFHAEIHKKVRFHCFQCGGEELQSILSYGDVMDLAILDLHFEENQGIQLAKQLQAKKPNIPIIFFTNEETHSAEASELLAFGILRKSVEEALFKRLYVRAWRQVEQLERQAKRLFIEFVVKKKRIYLQTKLIISMEKLQKKVIFKTKLSTYEVRITLNEVQEQLPSHFLRISQSVIVNVNEIICIEGKQVFLSTKDDFYIGSTYKDKVDKFYRKYCSQC